MPEKKPSYTMKQTLNKLKTCNLNDLSYSQSFERPEQSPEAKTELACLTRNRVPCIGALVNRLGAVSTPDFRARKPPLRFCSRILVADGSLERDGGRGRKM